MAYINPQLRVLYEKNNRFFVGLSIILFIGLAYLSYTKFNQLAQVNDEIETFTLAKNEIDVQYSENTVEFQKQEKKYSDRLKEATLEIEKIFPANPELTNFTRMIDDYFRRNNFSGNKAMLKSMILGEPVRSENYTMTPISMNVTSSQSNFINFLKYVENSGALKSDTRVMEIEAIDITFKEENENEYEYRISMNVYSKPQITEIVSE